MPAKIDRTIYFRIGERQTARSSLFARQGAVDGGNGAAFRRPKTSPEGIRQVAGEQRERPIVECGLCACKVIWPPEWKALILPLPRLSDCYGGARTRL